MSYRPIHPVILACGLIQVAGWVFLTLLSHGRWSEGFAYETANNLMPTWAYVAVQGATGIALIATFLWAHRRSMKISVSTIVLFAVAIRLIAAAGEPIHESDFYRYLWDGKMAKNKINPYLLEPGALYLYENEIDTEFDDETTGVTWRGRNFSEQEQQVLEKMRALREENPAMFARISHQAVTTIYPPAAQWIFQFSASCFGDSIIGMKAIFILFDLGAVALIILILGKLQHPQSGAILYAWNPLVIKEFSNSAHYDSAAIFFMLLAVWLALLPIRHWKKLVLIAAALAIGTLTKYFAILLLPVILLHLQEKRTFRVLKSPSIWIGTGTFFAVLISGFYPYFLWDDAGVTEVFRGLATYQEHWQYSPGLFALLERFLNLLTSDSFAPAKKFAGLLLTACVLWIALFGKRDLCEKCFIAVAALFLLSPTAFPWYYCWVLAFVPFQPRISWVVFSLLLPLNYLDFHSPGNIPLANVLWGPFFATQVLSWGIFLLTWISESVYRHFH
ncbi:MAG: glycosyltransferase family 39 protein [Verrucomicrobiales bacterium]|nr:glycosyltransferase family 39 protein [Verrucomicrobiales bacterium]